MNITFMTVALLFLKYNIFSIPHIMDDSYGPIDTIPVACKNSLLQENSNI